MTPIGSRGVSKCLHHTEFAQLKALADRPAGTTAWKTHAGAGNHSHPNPFAVRTAPNILLGKQTRQRYAKPDACPNGGTSAVLQLSGRSRDRQFGGATPRISRRE